MLLFYSSSTQRRPYGVPAPAEFHQGFSRSGEVRRAHGGTEMQTDNHAPQARWRGSGAQAQEGSGRLQARGDPSDELWVRAALSRNTICQIYVEEVWEGISVEGVYLFVL